MLLSTSRFGEIDIAEDKIIHFPQGIPGFEDCRGFVVLQPDESLPFSFIQSVEDSTLAFIVTNPFHYFPDYEFELPKSAEEALEIDNPSDVTICSIVSIGGQTDIQLNLLAPIVLNTKQRKGRQVILHHTAYHTKHRIPISDAADKQAVKEG